MERIHHIVAVFFSHHMILSTIQTFKEKLNTIKKKEQFQEINKPQ